ncbi:unnamed protein product [Brassica rapa subsp. trilocularis]
MLRLLTLSLALIALINSSNIPITTATPPGINQNDKKFVQTACNSTPYPTMCYYSLSSAYSSTIKSDPIKLCLTSLNVNLKSAKSASSIVSSLLKKVAFSPEVPNILKGCLKEMKDTADELKQVFAEIIKGLDSRPEESQRGRLKGSWKPVVYAIWYESHTRSVGEAPQPAARLLIFLDKLVRNKISSLKKKTRNKYEKVMKI